jgi:hypothetical protein
MTTWGRGHGGRKKKSMGDLQDSVAVMVEHLRSTEPIEPADRDIIAMWLQSMAYGLEHLDTLMHAMEAKVVTRDHLTELEAWVAQLKMDYELQQMGFDPDAPAKPQWLRDSGEAVP